MSAGRWMTATELAGLPGMPGSERAVRKRALDAGWDADPQFSRPRAGRGGGRLYSVDALPIETRQWLAREAAEAQAERSAAKLPTPKSAGKAAQRAEAALQVLALWDSYRPARPGSTENARAEFCRLYNERAIDGPDWLFEIRKTISKNTLRSLEQKRDRGELTALGGAYGNRKGDGLIDRDEDFSAFLIGMIDTSPHISAKLLHASLAANFDDGRPLPSTASVRRWATRWKRENAAVHLKRTDPDRYKSSHRLALGKADQGIERLNQVWELDSTPADVMLTDGRRHAIIGAIDVYSRRLKLLVAPTSRATAIAALLRRAILDWGVPESLKTDNGSDYVSRHITRALVWLQIEQNLCPPFTPEAKPHIERAFRTFSHDLAEMLPGFVGHSVAERKQIEARRSFAQRLGQQGGAVEIAMSAEELQTFCDRWCENLYERRSHSGLDGLSPFEKAAGWTGRVSRVDSERALDVLLAEAPAGSGLRTVGKTGIRLDGGQFMGRELIDWIGKRVLVKFDETDIGRIFCFDPDGESFIGEAVDLGRLDAGTRSEFAATMRAEQRKAERQKAEQIKAAGRTVDRDAIVRKMLAKAETEAGQVTPFPRPADSHETPALDAAAAAARGPAEIEDLNADQLAAADAVWDALAGDAGEGETGEAKVVALPTARRAGGRPAFTDDADLAQWILDHEAEADDDDRAWLAEKITGTGFRLLFDLTPADATAIRARLRVPRSEQTKQEA